MWTSCFPEAQPKSPFTGPYRVNADGHFRIGCGVEMNERVVDVQYVGRRQLDSESACALRHGIGTGTEAHVTENH